MDALLNILSNHSGYDIDELIERNSEPIIQPNDCIISMMDYGEQLTGKVCEWQKRNLSYDIQCTSYDKHDIHIAMSRSFNYCPFCGSKIERI